MRALLDRILLWLHDAQYAALLRRDERERDAREADVDDERHLRAVVAEMQAPQLAEIERMDSRVRARRMKLSKGLN